MAIDPNGPEEKFLELGERLASQTSSAEELYSLLDAIDGQLSRVEQSPSQSMLDALQPIMKALAGKKLLRHSDMDVKVVVASCISEITRITAPDAPYDDDVMKEIFQMIVAAFVGLDDTSSRSFQKRVSILETVAKVRSCVVMLDLECDALILQMFHHFLKTIRADHSENVFSSMETIMSLVIEESEEISSDLLSCLLDNLKNENKEVLPIAQKLAERVISTCASKIKPYLVELVQSTGALSEYNKIVASICQENSDASDQNEIHASGEVQADDSKLSERTVSDELPQVSAKMEEEVSCPEKVDAATDVAPVDATSNGTVQLGNGDSMEQLSFPKQTSESSDRNGQSKNAVSDRADGDSLETIAVKQDGTTDIKKGKGQKPNSSVQSTDTTDNSRIDSDKDAPVVTNRRKGRTKETDSSQVETSAKEVEPAVSSEHEKNDEPLSGPDNPTTVASLPPVESTQNSSRTKRGRPPGSRAAAKRTDVDAGADPPTSASVENDPSGNSEPHDEATEGDDSKKEPEDADNGEAPTNSAIDSEVKARRNTGKKGRFKRKTAEQESSARKQKPSTKQQKEKDTLVKDVDGGPSLKEMASSPRSTLKALRSTSKAPSADQTPLEDSVKPKSSRKRPLETEDIPETPEHKKEADPQLVGSKIKVWWPDDKMFYDGVVDSYDPTTKKHKIVYADGDIEVLLLKNERWEHVESDSEKDGGKQTAEGSASQMSRSKKAKASLNAVSKQAKPQQKFKSGKDSSSKDVPRPRGRPRGGTSNLGKLSYDDSAGTSKKSKGPSSDVKARTPRSSGKLEDEPENESEDETPRSSSKQEESANRSKDVNSKGGTSKKGNVKDEPPKSGRKSKEAPKASIKVKDEISGGKSRDDSSKSKFSTPKTASISEVDEVSKNKGLKTKPKTNSTPKNGSDFKANGISSKGMAKVGKSGTTPSVSDGEATTTGGRKRKRKGRK